jgi:ATPase family associated with various cellular activities (AAA)
MLLSLAEARRTGVQLEEGFGDKYRALSEALMQQRREGLWPLPSSLTALDIDLLALTLAADAMPALAPRIQSLQSHIGIHFPSLALIQELFMLDTGAEVSQLFARLAPQAPLSMLGLITIEGEGPYQTLRPGPGVVIRLLGQSVAIGAPPGTRLITRKVTWDDLVLPPATIVALKEFAGWVTQRKTVFDTWGARYLPGPLALFSGPSGAGKTYSAAAVASALGEQTGEAWSLYALDLGRVMSKYVGETEKNLNRLLEALHGRRAVLQIDEADGLLGRRGEISDARDRYSNLEVSHMLSRFEAHEGPVILTTNLRANIDTAFLRRFQVAVDFPQPGLEARAQLWSRLLPPRVPRDGELAPEALGGAVALAGGAIHNAAVYASALAAGEDLPLSYRHIARAVWCELNKDGRSVRINEMGFLANHLEKAA